MYVRTAPPSSIPQEGLPALLQNSGTAWPPQPNDLQLPEPSLMNAHLQLQWAQHGPHQRIYPPSQSADLLHRTGASRFTENPGQNAYDFADGHVPELAPATWPPMQGSIPRLHAAARCLPYSGDYGGFGLDENRGIVPVGLPTLHNPSEAALQSIALERLRKENARLQTELSRSEREIARQKGLRESERSEFNDVRDRLKHSWANDRDDFARVKSTLRMKNAEHHAHSGRISQHLKDVEACNRALREFIVRNGFDVPIELDGPQIRRYISTTARSLANHDGLDLTIEADGSHRRFNVTTPRSLANQEVSTSTGSPEPFQELPSEQVVGAIDLYLQQTNTVQPARSSGSSDLQASRFAAARLGQRSPDRQTPRLHPSSRS